MPGFLSSLFTSRKARSRQIAKVCATTLRELGMTMGGNVYQLTNSKGKDGWLISLQVPEQFRISSTDALALRIYLSRTVESALALKPRSIRLLLSFNHEAKRLPFAESVLNSKWVRQRVPAWLDSKLSVGGPSSLPGGGMASRPGKPLPPVLRPNTGAIGSAPVSLPAKEQEQRLEELMASMGDDDEYQVLDGSMSDFDQALSEK